MKVDLLNIALLWLISSGLIILCWVIEIRLKKIERSSADFKDVILGSLISGFFGLAVMLILYTLSFLKWLLRWN